MIHLIRGRVISTSCICPPIPTRNKDWSAIDDATYDGAPDSSPAARCQGFGATEQEAIEDLVGQLEEHGILEPVPPVTFAAGFERLAMALNRVAAAALPKPYENPEWCSVCDRAKDDCGCVENGGNY